MSIIQLDKQEDWVAVTIIQLDKQEDWVAMSIIQLDKQEDLSLYVHNTAR